jgi:hypothetical protein
VETHKSNSFFNDKQCCFFFTTTLEENPNKRRYEVPRGTKTAFETSETSSGYSFFRPAKTYPGLLMRIVNVTLSKELSTGWFI